MAHLPQPRVELFEAVLQAALATQQISNAATLVLANVEVLRVQHIELRTRMEALASAETQVHRLACLYERELQRVQSLAIELESDLRLRREAATSALVSAAAAATFRAATSLLPATAAVTGIADDASATTSTAAAASTAAQLPPLSPPLPTAGRRLSVTKVTTRRPSRVSQGSGSSRSLASQASAAGMPRPFVHTDSAGSIFGASPAAGSAPAPLPADDAATGLLSTARDVTGAAITPLPAPSSPAPSPAPSRSGISPSLSPPVSARASPAYSPTDGESELVAVELELTDKQLDTLRVGDLVEALSAQLVMNVTNARVGDRTLFSSLATGGGADAVPTTLTLRALGLRQKVTIELEGASLPPPSSLRGSPGDGDGYSGSSGGGGDGSGGVSPIAAPAALAADVHEPASAAPIPAAAAAATTPLLSERVPILVMEDEAVAAPQVRAAAPPRLPPMVASTTTTTAVTAAPAAAWPTQTAGGEPAAAVAASPPVASVDASLLPPPPAARDGRKKSKKLKADGPAEPVAAATSEAGTAAAPAPAADAGAGVEPVAASPEAPTAAAVVTSPAPAPVAGSGGGGDGGGIVLTPSGRKALAPAPAPAPATAAASTAAGGAGAVAAPPPLHVTTMTVSASVLPDAVATSTLRDLLAAVVDFYAPPFPVTGATVRTGGGGELAMWSAADVPAGARLLSALAAPTDWANVTISLHLDGGTVLEPAARGVLPSAAAAAARPVHHVSLPSELMIDCRFTEEQLERLTVSQVVSALTAHVPAIARIEYQDKVLLGKAQGPGFTSLSGGTTLSKGGFQPLTALFVQCRLDGAAESAAHAAESAGGSRA